jgi:hypothetical protein
VSFYRQRDSSEHDGKSPKLRLKLAPVSIDLDHNPDRRPSDSRFVLDTRRVLLEVRGLGAVLIDFQDQILIFTEEEIRLNQISK